MKKEYPIVINGLFYEYDKWFNTLVRICPICYERVNPDKVYCSVACEIYELENAIEKNGDNENE